MIRKEVSALRGPRGLAGVLGLKLRLSLVQQLVQQLKLAFENAYNLQCYCQLA